MYYENKVVMGRKEAVSTKALSCPQSLEYNKLIERECVKTNKKHFHKFMKQYNIIKYNIL